MKKVSLGQMLCSKKKLIFSLQIVLVYDDVSYNFLWSDSLFLSYMYYIHIQYIAVRKVLALIAKKHTYHNSGLYIEGFFSAVIFV